jgi:hypothetical protein
MTGVQLDASAHAPCTSTTVGFGAAERCRCSTAVCDPFACAVAVGASVNAQAAAAATLRAVIQDVRFIGVPLMGW